MLSHSDDFVTKIPFGERFSRPVKRFHVAWATIPKIEGGASLAPDARVRILRMEHGLPLLEGVEDRQQIGGRTDRYEAEVALATRHTPRSLAAVPSQAS